MTKSLDLAVSEYHTTDGGSNSFSIRLHDLEDARLWVAWKEIPRPGEKPKKMPFDPRTGRWAKSDNPTTWGTRATAEKRAKLLLKGSTTGGVGLMFDSFPDADGWRLGGVDLDSCRDPKTGDLASSAEDVILRFSSYTEASPSKTGAKVFFIYRAADLETLRQEGLITNFGRSWSLGDHTEIALHLGGRYFTVTGDVIPDEISDIVGYPDDLLQPVGLETLKWLIEQHGPNFKREKAEPGELATSIDTSGSGRGWQFMAGQYRLGRFYEDAREAILDDDNDAGEWASRVEERQLRRAWEFGVDYVEERDPLNQFVEIDAPEERAELGLPKLDPIVCKMNKRHAVVALANKTAIATFHEDGRVDFIGEKDLNTLYANERVPVGRNKTESSAAYWIKHTQRRTYPNGVVFDPRGSTRSGALNLWRGLAVEPDPDGDCGLFLTHLLDVICEGDTTGFEYLIRWLAHLAQRPGEKPEVAVVLKGSKGVGKDMVAEYVARIIGAHHCRTIAQPDQLTGKFNAHMAATLLLNVQEGEWAGNRKAEGVLKYLVTSKRIGIERKGVDLTEVDSFMRIFITSNERWVVPASWDERRYAVFDAGEKQGPDYYRELAKERDGSGPAALLHYLLNVDLSEFDVRTPPATKGLLEQKLASLRNIDRWWFEFLFEGEFPDAHVFGDDGTWAEQRREVERSVLHKAYESWMQRQHYSGEVLGSREFGKRLRKLCTDLKGFRATQEGQRLWCYRVPALPRCRELFSVALTGEVTAIEWDG